MTGNAKLTFESDIRQLERNNEKLTRDFAKMKEQLRLLKAEGSNAGREMSKGMKETSGFVSGLVSQYLSVGAAIGAVTFAYREWQKETEAVAAAHKKLAADLVKVVSASSLSGPQTSRWIAGLKTATREQGIAALSGVTQAQPFMPQARQMALAEEAARQAPTGTDLTMFGGAMADVGAIAEGKSAQDVADLAVKAQQLAGEKFQALRSDPFQRGMAKMVEAGKSPEQAIAAAIVAADQDFSGKSFLSGKARLDKAKVEETTAALLRAEREDVSNEQLRKLATYPEGRAALGGQSIAIATDAAGRAEGEETNRVIRMQELERSIAIDKGGLAPATAAAGRGISAYERFVNSIFPAPNVDEKAQQHFAESQRRKVEALAGEAKSRGLITGEQAQQFTRADELAKQQIAELRALNQTLQQTNRQRGALNTERHNEP